MPADNLSNPIRDWFLITLLLTIGFVLGWIWASYTAGVPLWR